MKRVISTLLAIYVIAGEALATPVGLERARETALAFLATQGCGKDVALVAEAWPGQGLWIFNGAGLFVVVSADDAARPILGYSLDGELHLSEIAPATKYWLEQYDGQVVAAQDAGLEADKEVAAQWEALGKEEPLQAKYAESVSPLLTTKWGQGFPYNALCPVDSTGSHVPTGCVATAVAQIMNYWQWPEHGKGQHSYSYDDNPAAVEDWQFGTISFDYEHTTFNWDMMPKKITVNSGADTIEAVATLMHGCGVAFDATYKPGGTGAFLLDENVLYDTSLHLSTDIAVEHRVVEFLDYANSLLGEMRMDYGDEEWNVMVKNELSAGMPMIYTGFKFDDEGIATGGHAFVVDGYNKPGYFHVNWGWNGTADGHFALEALNITSMGYTFNDRQGAIFNLKPSTLQRIAQVGRDDGFRCWSDGLMVHLCSEKPLSGTIYDMTGRAVCRFSGIQQGEWRMPGAGVYVVKVGGEGRKVAVTGR